MSSPKRRPVVTRAVRAVCAQLTDYCDHTSLHGLKYVTEGGRHWLERVLWFVGCALGVYGTVLLMDKVWTTYRTSPTITSVESTHYPIWNIPFPAVTVCNVNKVRRSAAKDLYEHLNLSKVLHEEVYNDFVKKLGEMIQPLESHRNSINDIEKVRKRYNLTMEKMMKQLTQPCTSLIVGCKWQGYPVNCSTLFRQERTDAGFCCSFNYFAPDRNSTGRERHVNGAGYLTGLTVLIDPILDDYYSALFSFYGLQVLVHSPHNFPDITARGVIINPTREAFMQVTAESTYSSDDVRELNPEQRECLFEDENSPDRTLGTNNYYSYRNCLVQCKLRYMHQLCNCTPYYFPSYRDSQTCGLKDVQCLAKYRLVFRNVKPDGDAKNLVDNENVSRCECHPTCSEVNYKTELSQGLLLKNEFDRIQLFKDVDITNHSILHVYFKELSSIRFRRDVLFSWNDLLASLGGIAGLFLGCSLLSVVEFIYYFSLRPVLGLKDRPKKPLPKASIVKVAPKDFLRVAPPYQWVH